MDSLLTLVDNFNIVANASENIVNTLRAYVGPFLLIFIALMSLKFIKDQQFMALISFIVIALVVIIIFYTPGILKSIATAFTGETGIDTTGNNSNTGGGGV